MPRLFIASSTKSLPLARALEGLLEGVAEVRVWDETSPPLGYLLAYLIEELSSCDLGLFILAGDDALDGDIQRTVPRANVVLELGILVGAVGHEAALLLVPADDTLELPSDLDGVLRCEYDPKKAKADPGQALEAVAERIREFILGRAHPVRTRTLYYLAPGALVSDFFGRFCGGLVNALCAHRVSVRPVPLEGSPAMTLARLADRMRPGDAVVANAKRIGIESPGFANLLRVLSQPGPGRVVFVDRRPPDALLHLDRVSFVGVNNYRVGVLAAYCLHRAMDVAPTECAYLAIGGPGGEERVGAFEHAIGEACPGAVLERIWIHDEDRFETRSRVVRECNHFIKRHGQRHTGIFSGNDETASTLCHELPADEDTAVCVVGCDATPEMRQWIEAQHSVAVATMTNELNRQSAIEQVIGAMDRKIILSLDPSPLPGHFIHSLLADRVFSDLWHRTANVNLVREESTT